MVRGDNYNHFEFIETFASPYNLLGRAALLQMTLARACLLSDRLIYGEPGRIQLLLTPSMALLAGTRLGPYEILAPIGAGGMGEVYRARDSRLERDVAIKILPEHLSQNPQALARFVRETKTVAALSHPNLLAIFDTGTENGISYAVTELLDGESLRAGLVRSILPWRKTAEIGAALAEGIAAAHSKGITHRDLKPENIFLTADGRVKVLDFGLARIETHQTGADAETQTEAGTVLGTPGYMSPEQVRGIRAGPASDIFSLGCVMYEMLSGRRAFPGQSAAETMSSILRDTPEDLAASGIEIPPELNRLIARCLEKNPQQRCQAASDLAFHLKALLSGPVPSASRAIDSIAVLPFTNASRDPDTEYLCDGITESIMNSLARISQLRVTPRSTVFRYKASNADPQAVGRELNVRAVLTGRVMQRSETLIVGTELMDVVAATQLWGERYNRKMADIFEVEEEIARKISESLRMKLTGEEKSRLVKRFTENTEAYQLYLRGRHHWAKRTPDRVRKGSEYFQQAIEKDPSYALAYSGLADCYSILGVYSILPSKEAFAKAKAAAVAAVAFDDELAEGHTSLGFIKAYLDWDWAGGAKEVPASPRPEPRILGCAVLVRTGSDLQRTLRRSRTTDPIRNGVGAAFARDHAWCGDELRLRPALPRGRRAQLKRAGERSGLFSSPVLVGTGLSDGSEIFGRRP
jgi:serine/threonine protein kinase